MINEDKLNAAIESATTLTVDGVPVKLIIEEANS